MKFTMINKIPFIFLVFSIIGPVWAKPTPARQAPAGRNAQTNVSLWKEWVDGALIENGIYKFTEENLQDYFQNNPYTRGLITLKGTPDQSLLYKINERSEFQAKNWYGYYQNLAVRQQRWSFDINGFIQRENATTFNEAKKKFYSRLDFNTDTFLHDRPYHYLKEWGGLNHPPLASLSGHDPSLFSRYYEPFNGDDPGIDGSLYFNPAFQSRIDQVSHSELTAGNTFDLLADDGSFRAKLQLIETAQKFIWVSSLVFVSDSPTWQIAKALVQKAKQGLDVRAMDENTLRHVHPAVIAYLRKNGIKVVNADDFFKYNTESIYHTKVLIVDGKTVIMGGQNMIDADLGSHGTDFKNRDVDVKITGPVTTDVMASFMEDWNHFVLKKKLFDSNTNLPPFKTADFVSIAARKNLEKQKGLRGTENYSRWLGDRATRMKGLGRYVPQKPYKTPSVITDTYLAYLDGVTRYLGITNPEDLDTYKGGVAHRRLRPIYAPHANFDRLFKKVQGIITGRPSVHVDYLTSGVDFGLNEAVPMTADRIFRYLQKGDYVLANANQVWMDDTNMYLAPGPYENLLRDYVPHQNVDVWIYVSFMHSKIFFFDRIAASVGSFNFHHNSTDQAYESTLIALDSTLNHEIERTMTLDMANSVPLVFKQLTGRRFSKKFDEARTHR